ncbi:MAG TPA: glycogen/starch synthase, partial [Candidatus Omnitrophota bacterium]|nr:glycogen/starch synthase [Candidatus Omnitrophota bacterium]
ALYDLHWFLNGAGCTSLIQGQIDWLEKSAKPANVIVPGGAWAGPTVEQLREGMRDGFGENEYGSRMTEEVAKSIQRFIELLKHREWGDAVTIEVKNVVPMDSGFEIIVYLRTITDGGNGNYDYAFDIKKPITTLSILESFQTFLQNVEKSNRDFKVTNEQAKFLEETIKEERQSNDRRLRTALSEYVSSWLSHRSNQEAFDIERAGREDGALGEVELTSWADIRAKTRALVKEILEVVDPYLTKPALLSWLEHAPMSIDGNMKDEIIAVFDELSKTSAVKAPATAGSRMGAEPVTGTWDEVVMGSLADELAEREEESIELNVLGTEGAFSASSNPALNRVMIIKITQGLDLDRSKVYTVSEDGNKFKIELAGGARMTAPSRSILFAAMESGIPGMPKAGGEFDYNENLPRSLVELGQKVSLVTPNFAGTTKEGEIVRALWLPIGYGNVLINVRAIERHGVKYFLLEDPSDVLFNGDAKTQNRGLYRDADKKLRGLIEAIILARATMELGKGSDILHLNDWQTGLVPFYARTPEYKKDYSRTADIYISHNMAYKGLFDYVMEIDPKAEDFDPALVSKLMKDGVLIRGRNFDEENGLIKIQVVNPKKPSENLFNLPASVVQVSANHQDLEYYGKLALGKGPEVSEELVAVSETNLEEMQIDESKGGAAFGFEAMVRRKAREGRT